MNIMKSKAGFTLVELIVVIAILGILAGIAVPAYSGYIKKAEAAQDTQVQSAINTAIAAACTENNVAFTDAKTHLAIASAAKGDGTGYTVTFSAYKAANASEPTTAATNVFNDFKVYFGSDKADFKYYTGATIGNDGNLVMTEPAA